jgi:hypothetical protein
MSDLELLDRLLHSVLDEYILELPDPPSVIPQLLQEHRPVSLVSFIFDLIPHKVSWASLQAAGIIQAARMTTLAALDVSDMVRIPGPFQYITVKFDLDADRGH